MSDESHFVNHLPCSACGSSDANSLYSDGHTFCMKCRAYQHGSGEQGPSQQPATRKTTVLLEDVSIGSLTKRGIHEATCAKYGYGTSEYKGRPVQVAPYCDAKGRVIAQKIRFPDKTFMIAGDASQMGLFGQHLWAGGGRKIVVTEGEIDCLTVAQLQQLKWPTVSIPNGAPAAAKAVAKSIEFLETFEEVVFMFDMDEPGKKAAVECAALLSPGKARIAALPGKDPNALLQEGRGDAVIQSMWNAKPYRPDGIVAGDDVLTHLVSRKSDHTILFPHAGLNEKTRGMRTGELVTLTAGTGTGKSTLARECAYTALKAGEKVGYIALEEPVHHTVLGFCSLVLNKILKFNRDGISDDELRKVYGDNFHNRVVYYDHFGSLQAEHLLNKVRFMVRSETCSLIVLDHLSMMASGLEETDERRALDITMTKLASLAQELNVCILLVCHLKKSEGKPHEEGKPVGMSDLRGTHGIAQLSHTIVALERDQQSEEKHISTVRVLKCRWTGDTGLAGHMAYDKSTGRLLETVQEFANSTTEGEF